MSLVAAEDVAIRPLVVDDAPALAQCFERCYGASYVVAEFYDPAATAARIRDGSLRSIVAVTPGGEIVGHMGLTIRDPRATTVDAGNSIVDPRYRGRQIVALLALHVIELCRAGGYLGFHHYPTTVHPIMQRLAVAGDGIETGIMLDYIPAGTEYREIEGDPRQERPAVVVVYHPLRSAPARQVFVPGPLGELAREIYAHESLTRTIRADAAALPNGPTRLRSTLSARRGLFRIEMERIGDDVCDAVAAALAGTRAPVLQVDLPMSESCVDAAADALRALGFFFSAILPEYLEGDVLRLQRLAAAAVTPPDLATPGGVRILRAIEADYARTRALGR